MAIETPQPPRVLLTGATGYIGGRLLPLLERRGGPLRCLVRQPARLVEDVATTTEVVAGDLLDRASLEAALAGIDIAYYLVHSMGSSGDFADADRQAAENFAYAARSQGVRRIVYLGGLGDDAGELSPHLESRHEVGRLLRESGCQVIEFRASIVIGSGSLSFELVRALVERLPVMICPRWVNTLAQPIAVEDVLAYLLEALDWPETESRVFEIGGPDRVTYGDIMQAYARQRGLRRYLISVPVLTPRLSSLWLAVVTPLYARVGRKLVESMRNPTTLNDPAALTSFRVQPRGLAAAIERAVVNEDREIAQTRWSDATSSSARARSGAARRFGARAFDTRVRHVSVPPPAAFRPVRRIGGERGWYFANALWTLRGWIDLAVGGIGLRRGRRDPEHLRIGDTLDWWRVEDYQPDRLLRLKAEMRLPGRAWLEFSVEPDGNGSTIRQTAIFDPHGLAGRFYWYALIPLHAIVFRGMLRKICHIAESPLASGDLSARPASRVSRKNNEGTTA
ncbi:MAG: DUF2867 domain-containing protein [Planctomycetota bacterium]|nr:MAG: DUF2867 domain-containing protein [Planctomycetota bacterium]